VRYAILSDVHANLEALRAVLDDAADRADAILCLGDTVGYGADPGPCVELMGERAVASVAGNHEWAVTGQMDLQWFNPYAREAAEWTHDRLDDECRAYLGALPLVAEVGDALLVHASPARPDEWDYILSADDGFAVLAHFATRLCFVGHSHVPGAWSIASSGRTHERGAVHLRLEQGRRYLVNVGSVGQPRDRDVRAAYAIWDVEARAVEIRRVGYDVETARRKIVAAGLPSMLGDRLRAGR
jgi:diadenosine tetraphosphatase ApaH/serine/threonine PP2A family protein phosphatase